MILDRTQNLIEIAHAFYSFFRFSAVGGIGFFVKSVKSVQPSRCGNFNARIPQSLFNRDTVTLSDGAGPRPALDRSSGSGAVKRNFLCLQRERSVIFQKHKTFGCRPPRQRPVGQFDFIGLFLCSCKYNIFHNPFPDPTQLCCLILRYVLHFLYPSL